MRIKDERQEASMGSLFRFAIGMLAFAFLVAKLSGPSEAVDATPAPVVVVEEVTPPQPVAVELAPSVPWIQARVQGIVGEDVDLEDVLWLARGAMSETQDTLEARAIMWVIRNRVTTRYRRKSTYKDVVLDPYQFSAFNSPKLTKRYTALDWGTTQYPKWLSYLRIAAEVRVTPEKYNFVRSTSMRHFVHQEGLESEPNWLPDEPTLMINDLSIYGGVD